MKQHADNIWQDNAYNKDNLQMIASCEIFEKTNLIIENTN